jgi:hypothetical protein
MPRRQLFVNVSAAVSPAVAEEIDRLAKSNGVTKSTMVRTLLEERLTDRANERLSESYEKLEKRLKHIESRFSSFLAKAVRLIAQDLYLDWYYLRTYTELGEDKAEMKKVNEEARNFAGQQLQQLKKSFEDELTDDVV